MSKASKNALIFLSVVVAGLVIFYLGMTYYYSHPGSYITSDGQRYQSAKNEKCFLYGSYINGIYCTGMTAEQVEELLYKNYEGVSYNIIFEGKNYEILPENIDYSVSFSNKVKNVLSKQNAFLWPQMLTKGADFTEIVPDISYDEEKLIKELENIGLVEKKVKSDDVYIYLSDDGYVLHDKDQSVLKAESAREYVLSQIAAGETNITISDEFYDSYEYTKEEEALVEYYNKIEEFQRKYVAYIFGKEKKTISKRQWASLLNTGEREITRIGYKQIDTEDICFTVDEAKAADFIAQFLDEYNTLNNKYFKTHSGKVVYVTKATYGNKLDIEREQEWFKEFVNSNQTSSTRVPVYLHEANFKEKNDFGDTYIEVSIDEQHMWYYKDGEIFVETDITSGGPAVGGTWPRVCYVYSMIPNKWLNGPTWHVFVNYWVAIDGSIGIHDSSWRDVYGGNEYMTNGSHGCINTPHDAMQKIYENLEIGTPVIVYSFKKNEVNKKLD